MNSKSEGMSIVERHAKIKQLEEQIVCEKNARVSKHAMEKNVESLQNRIKKLTRSLEEDVK